MSYESEELKEKRLILKWTTLSILMLISLIVLLLVFVPKYRVWQKELRGKADLKEAEWNRQIKVQEAKALMESAEYAATAEITRAKGVAAANEIIGQSLNNNEAYLRYLWINGLQTNEMQVIYVPTEANLPILEATRNK